MINIKVVLLQVLKLSRPYRLPESTLREHAAIRCGHPLGDEEFSTALEELRAKGMADFEIDALTRDRRWKITAAGEGQIN